MLRSEMMKMIDKEKIVARNIQRRLCHNYVSADVEMFGKVLEERGGAGYMLKNTKGDDGIVLPFDVRARAQAYIKSFLAGASDCVLVQMES